jgi:two-component system chemotaxis response regulator CheY
MSLGRVLVVDDDPDIRQSVRLILTKAGYDVIEAEDGQHVVEEVKSGDNPLMLNAIVCDLQMPNMSGMEAIPFFRSQFPSCPVVVLTGAGTVENSSILFKQGVIDFLSKPVDHKRLLGAVGNAVAQSGYKDDYVT